MVVIAAVIAVVVGVVIPVAVFKVAADVVVVGGEVGVLLSKLMLLLL